MGKQSINLPTPAGYVNAWDKYPDLRSAFEINEDANNQMLAMYAPLSSIPGLNTGRYLGFPRYSRVSVSKRLADTFVSPAEFDQFATAFQERVKSMFKAGDSTSKKAVEEIKRDLKKQFGTDGGFALSSPVNLGTIKRDKHSYICASVVSVETLGKQIPLYVGTGLVLVKSRILFVYLYANVESPDDIDVYNTDTEKMLAAILAANPVKEIRLTKLPGK
ncbi:MAG: hypothetical protein ACT4O9_04140 [Blastocatellia bacterium]